MLESKKDRPITIENSKVRVVIRRNLCHKESDADLDKEVKGYHRGHEVRTLSLIFSAQGSTSWRYDAILCLLASSMLPRLLATIALRRLFSAVLDQDAPPRSPPNSASACIPSSSSDATSRTSGLSGSGDTTFRFTLRAPDDGSLGLEEEDDGGRDSGGESSRSRIELDARLSVGAGEGGSGFLIFL